MIRPPLYFLYKECEQQKMSMNFAQGASLADLERQMRMVPNFAPRKHGRRNLRRYRPTAADVDCRYCLHYRHRICQSRTCPYLAERLEAGAATLTELAAETVRAWRYIPLKRRTMSVMRRTDSVRLEGQLHLARLTDALNGRPDRADSTWLAAVYLLSARTELWTQTSRAVRQCPIDLTAVRLNGVSTQDYILYQAAKGIPHGTLGATSEELADRDLVTNNTLLLVLSAALIARYGPQVMKIGRAAR